MLRQPAGLLFPLVASVGLIAPAGAAEIDVTIAKLTFAPANVTAQVGDTIKWVNTDFVAHTATARDKSFDVAIPAHGTGTLIVKSAGTFDYFCRFHPMMKGNIQVNGG